MATQHEEMLRFAESVGRQFGDIEHRLSSLEKVVGSDDDGPAVIDHEHLEAKSMATGHGYIHRYQLPRQGWWLVVVDKGNDQELAFRVQHDNGKQIVLSVVGETTL